jgi:DNA-binding Xre family transcriptional regulator
VGPDPAFAELLAETFPTAEEQSAHEREVAKLVAFAELLIALDEVRAGSQLSKAELARRIGVKPSVVSRLLDGKGRNVQLDTIADVADALDVYIEMRVRPQMPSDTRFPQTSDRLYCSGSTRVSALDTTRLRASREEPTSGVEPETSALPWRRSTS